MSPYLTNSVEPAKCGSQLFPILRLSLDLAWVQQIVSLCCACVFLCVHCRGTTETLRPQWALEIKYLYRMIQSNAADLQMCLCVQRDDKAPICCMCLNMVVSESMSVLTVSVETLSSLIIYDWLIVIYSGFDVFLLHF